MWTLICAFLVIFMQAGFAMMAAGFTRAKNAGHTMAMNMMVFVIAVLGYWSIGYGLQTGGKGFFLSGAATDASIITLFLSSVVYLNIAATVPTGAMAERWTFKSFVVYAFFIAMFIYPLYARWVWGGGWLSQLGGNFGLGHGVLDFAGSSVFTWLEESRGWRERSSSALAWENTGPAVLLLLSPGIIFRWPL